MSANRPIPELKQLPVWKQFEAQATPDQISNMGKLVGIAKAKLLQIRDTFPTYTLHDHEHADNVLYHMGQLLGEEVDKLTALEAAMLILSAYFHDTGMAFTEGDRSAIRHEEHFDEFQRKYPEALVAVVKTEGDQLPADIVEWYCRWRHAERVFTVLEEVGGHHPGLLVWNTQNIAIVLGDLCRSHNLDAVELKDDTQFPNDFRAGECDLRFCAVLLRLADILDFDRTRSPEQLYQDLGLKNRQDRPGRTSDLEWRKHLHSEGFKYPTVRSQDYPLAILAGPDTPAVEYDIRKFMDVIEDELTRCASLLNSCSDRWRKHPLPGSVDRRGILGNGYTYGEHRFVLDQREVLQLLMGDKLYENPYVFIREILQNALDASRHREFQERSGGNPHFKCQPIVVSDWVDANGYQWVRFEDYGMGMTEQIINNYLLKVGKSYYNSAQFEADVIRYAQRTGDKFKPVSRFGIGLLSCFIVGDRLEISTRHAVEKNNPIRLSLSGVQDFFILQKHPNSFSKMPAPGGEEPGKRNLPGTTLCVRLDPVRDRGVLHLAGELNRTLLCPEIPVLYEGERIGGSPEELLHKPWCEPVVIPLPPEDTARIGKLLGKELKQPVAIQLFPIDFTRYATTPLIQGQMIGVALQESNELAEALEIQDDRNYNRGSEERAISVELYCQPRTKNSNDDDGVALFVRVLARFRRKYNARTEPQPEFISASCEVDLASYLLVSDFLPFLTNATDTDDTEYLAERSKSFGHNGLHLPVNRDDTSTEVHFNAKLFYTRKLDLGSPCWGIVMLKDDLRPEITISRDKLIDLPWNIRSAVNLSLRRAVMAVLKPEPALFNEIFNWKYIAKGYISLGEYLKDEMLTSRDGWACEKIFMKEGGNLYSIKELINNPALRTGLYSFQHHLYPGRTYRIICDFLAYYWTEPFVQYNGRYDALILLGEQRVKPISDAEKLFPPLCFVPYVGNHGGILRAGKYTPFNRYHPFCEWLLANAVYLHHHHSGIFRQLYNALIEKPYSYSYTEKEKEMVETVGMINRSLERIGQLNPQIKPPKKVFLTRNDFE